MTYDPSDHENGLLPPPIHVGKYMREKRMDFQLPYDIWWMQQRDMVSGNRGAGCKNIQFHTDLCDELDILAPNPSN